MAKCRVHIISEKREICSLIMKTIVSNDFEITCTHALFNSFDFLNDLENNVDCLVIDKGLDQEAREIINVKFSQVPVICLPSLNDESCYYNHARYMSEPFKISELKIMLEEISK